jgi:osmotically inducible protein OsmC
MLYRSTGASGLRLGALRTTRYDASALIIFTIRKVSRMPTRTAEAEWKGNLAEGEGTLKVGSGAFEGPYSFKSRFEEGQSATNPEELIGAAHAGCFTMALTAALSRAGIKPTRIYTTARVKLEKIGEAFSITQIDLETEAEIPGIDDAKFQELANGAKQNCPVSKALAATEIHLQARLLPNG